MLGTSGPKKTIDHGKPQFEDEDMSSFDLDKGSGNLKPAEAVEGQYRMKHTNQKFSVGGTRPSGATNQQEESIT